MSVKKNKSEGRDEQEPSIDAYLAAVPAPPPSPRLAERILRDALAATEARTSRPGLQGWRELWALLGGWRMLAPSAAAGLVLAMAVLGSNVDLGQGDEAVDLLSQAMLDAPYEEFLP